MASYGAELDRRTKEGDLGRIHRWANKLWGATARIAGILHMGDQVEGPGVISPVIAEQTMDRAIVIARYFEAHAIVAFGPAVLSAREEGARTVLGWIERRRQPFFDHRRAVRAHNGRLDGKAVELALEILLDHGHIRVAVHDGPRNRKPRYEVHPRLLRED